VSALMTHESRQNEGNSHDMAFAFIKQHKTLRIGIQFVLGVLEKRVHFAHAISMVRLSGVFS